MKKRLPAIFAGIALSVSLTAQNYSSQNVSMLGHWYNPSEAAEPIYGIKYQGIWGWHQASTNKEYAIIGGNAGTYFVDVTNPATPVLCDYVPGRRNNCIWHEIKSYQNYCYIASDDNGSNSFIIADMSTLPDSVHVVHDDTTIWVRCHTLYVDGDKLYGGSVTRKNNVYYSMAVYDLAANPAHPQLIHALNQDYSTPSTVHDMFVRNDTVFASGGYDGLYIYKFNDGTTNTFSQLATMTSYPDQGYNHSSFLTSDARTLIFMDEVPTGMAIKSLDVSNFGNLTVVDTFSSNPGNTPHNPYILGNNTLVASNYCDGLQVFDISNPANCQRTGYFDTDTLCNPANYFQAYHGNWGAYTDLPSGHILAADMQNGIYVLDISQAITSINETYADGHFSISPNPVRENAQINLTLKSAQTVRVDIYDNSGRLVSSKRENGIQGANMLHVSASGLADGIYMIQLSCPEFSGTQKLVVSSR